MREVVDSLPPSRGRVSRFERVDTSHCRLMASVLIGVFALLFALLVQAVHFAPHSILAGFWGAIESWLFGIATTVFLICLAVALWNAHEVKLAYDERRFQNLLLEESARQSHQVTLLMQEGRRNNDNMKVMQGPNGQWVVEVERRDTALELERMKHLARSIGQLDRTAQPPAISPPASAAEEEQPIPIPVAPDFWDVVHLITTEQMPLCFVVDTNPRSRTYGQTIPAFGTILDLLSLCIIGKPGRGKSVLLLFYICCLAKYGAEMHVLDPQGAFKELQLLHGKPLPAMPKTARIYYYSDLEEMEAAVSNVLAEIKVREDLHKPHLENGELKLHTLKHPLVVLADELPIIAEMDVEIKNRVKEENKMRKEEGLEQLKIQQVTGMVKTAVLAARKYWVFFIGAAQSIDATILPTRVSAGFNSRIVFSSSEQKARMAGLESEVAKRLLPVIRRAGPGKSIYDCARWDAPLIAAFPNVTIEDVLQFFGITMDELKELWAAELAAREQERRGTRITGPLDKAVPEIAPPKRAVRRATLADAIEVWNEAARAGQEIGRPRLREELVARGLECTDDLAKNFIRVIRQRLEAGGAGGE